MNNPIAVLLLFIALISVFVALQKFSIFWKCVWIEQRIDYKALIAFVFATVFFIGIFFIMKENPELLDINVSKANSAK